MYTETRNDVAVLLILDAFWDPATPLSELLNALHSDQWQVQQAALAAIGDRGERQALYALEALLEEQDGMDVYGCPDEWELDAAANVQEKEIWRCRFRVKQAALLALRSCALRHGSEVVNPGLLERVHRYALSQDEDYTVRAAACNLLSVLANPASREVVSAAMKDGEWCTATFARKALNALDASSA